jgi:hypothetical protein
MNEAAGTKVCPFCAETIKVAAKKCPFCNSRLARYALLRQELSMGFAVLLCCASFILLSALTFPEFDDIGGGRSFTPYRRDLKAAGIEVIVENQGTNAFYYRVSGLVTNLGQYPWRVKELELSITNSQGAVDVRHENVKDSFVVQPRGAHAFVFRYQTTLTNVVVSAQARVDDARDGDVPKSDD